MLLLLDTGIRVSELCSLTVEQVHEDYIKVFGKGRKEREVGIHPGVGKLLWKYLAQYRRPASPDIREVFLNVCGQPLLPNGVEQLASADQRAGRYSRGARFGTYLPPHVCPDVS
jgi:integrase/recombinase XerD